MSSQKSPQWRHTPPYSQTYRFIVTKAFVGLTLSDFFAKRFHFKPREHWDALILARDITLNRQGAQATDKLKLDDVIHTSRHDVTEPDVRCDYEFLAQQNDVWIINKPAPLPVHPSGRFYKNSLTSILKEDFPNLTFHTIHRLDLWTTGVLVIATEARSAKWLHHQMEHKTVNKIYGVLAKGDFGTASFCVDEVIGRDAHGERTFGEAVVDPKSSQTIFTPLAVNNDITLLKAELITGRTNQIRLHIKAKGGYVVGDPLHDPNANENVSFMGLHCRSMTLSTQYGMPQEKFEAPWPEHFINLFPHLENNLSSHF